MRIKAKDIIRGMNDFGIGDSLLRDIGLEYRQSSFTKFVGTIGVFSAGMLVGAALGMLYAPMRGDELRTKARDNIDAWRTKMASRGAEMAGRVSEKAARTQAAVETMPVVP